MTYTATTQLVQIRSMKMWPATPLNPPKQNISPLIRFSRWTALTAGVIYGIYRYNYLSTREVEIQKHENEIKERYRQKMEKIKQQRTEEEMALLGKEAGVASK
uniref:ATP synthase F(0) complex subunit e, mitochondrial n=2 Tax=Biomphalaria TaxID=6525 RepID=A0A2C9LUN9_BIOGL